MSWIKNILIHLIGPILALIASFIIGGIVIFVIGKDPLFVYSRFFCETLGNSYGVGQVLFRATPLMFTGLAAAISFRAGLFNIGAEGQLRIGSLATALTGVYLSGLPPIVLIPLCLMSGMLGGAIWGAIPGILKVKFGAHEVINTIMMNFIAAALVSYLVINIYAVPATVHTFEIDEAAQIGRLDVFMTAFRGSPVNVSLFLAISCCIVVYFLLWKTRLGYELRTLGLNPFAANYGGINTGSRTIIALTLSGSIAGLVGSNFVMGYKHYFELGFAEGIGFIGIAVALLAKNHPIGIILTSIFFGTLEYGSLTINTIVPKELSNILLAIVIIFMIIITKIMNRWILRMQERTSIAYNV
ncbi:MAG: ABC transporter permease [Ignavibacteriales bacterium]|nr:ABC transporter permease [Ignavibacteriales bacterium]